MADITLAPDDATRSTALATTNSTITFDPKTEAVYCYVDDSAGATLDDLAPFPGQDWLLLYSKNRADREQESSVDMKVASGTPTAYFRVF